MYKGSNNNDNNSASIMAITEWNLFICSRGLCKLFLLHVDYLFTFSSVIVLLVLFCSVSSMMFMQRLLLVQFMILSQFLLWLKGM
jgi:hypothetical protein